MNVGIVLEYFKYFTSFSHSLTTHHYFYATARSRFRDAEVTDLEYCDPHNLIPTVMRIPKGDYESYFKAAIKLSSIQDVITAKKLAVIYEEYFERFLSNKRIDLLITGGTTGFERCGLATAKRLGIKTLCVWEGFFRPNTISYDPDGMNAESSFYRKITNKFLDRIPSDKSIDYVEKYINTIRISNTTDVKLRHLQGANFSFKYQILNRWKDRNDYERIRLPFNQHVTARLQYYLKRQRYSDINRITKPFFFFPLQTHTDSNLVLNGDLFPFKSYINLIMEAFKIVSKEIDCALVIKEHPFDVFRISYPYGYRNDIHWISPEYSVLTVLQNSLCIGTITVNSTSGFESLLLNKPVISLGRSIYSHDGLVEKPKGLDVPHIADSLLNIQESKVDEEIIKKFACTLYSTLQIEGQINSVPTKGEIGRFEQLFEIITNKSKYKENAC